MDGIGSAWGRGDLQLQGLTLPVHGQVEMLLGPGSQGGWTQEG